MRKRKPKMVTQFKCDHCGTTTSSFVTTHKYQHFCRIQTPGFPADKDCMADYFGTKYNQHYLIKSLYVFMKVLDLVTAFFRLAPFQYQMVWGVQLSWLERSPVTQNPNLILHLLTINNERKYCLFRFTRKHRSLFGVENKIFQIENLFKILRTKLRTVYIYVFVVFITLKFRALDK